MRASRGTVSVSIKSIVKERGFTCSYTCVGLHGITLTAVGESIVSDLLELKFDESAVISPSLLYRKLLFSYSFGSCLFFSLIKVWFIEKDRFLTKFTFSTSFKLLRIESMLLKITFIHFVTKLSSLPVNEHLSQLNLIDEYLVITIFHRFPERK